MTKSTSPLGATGERLRPSGRSGVVQVFRVLTATTSDRWIATSVAGEVEMRTAVPREQGGLHRGLRRPRCGSAPAAHRRGGEGVALLPDGCGTPTSRRRVRAGHSLRGTAETGEVGTPRVVLADAEQMRTPRGSSRGKANAQSHLTRRFTGDPGWIRTNDTRFRRAVLYPLSYGANCGSLSHPGRSVRPGLVRTAPGGGQLGFGAFLRA